jgi:hypothetical protein
VRPASSAHESEDRRIRLDSVVGTAGPDCVRRNH